MSTIIKSKNKILKLMILPGIIFLLTIISLFIINKEQRKSPENEIGKDSPSLQKLQEEFLKLKFGMFVHFNMATFAGNDWATGYEDPLIFKPDKLNCNQWADAALAAGIKYAILTAKHTCGWGLWDSKYTSHDITAFKNYKNGKGDIVREFIDAFRSRKIKVGLYYCLPGNYSDDSLKPGQRDLNGLPPEAQGDYEGFIEKQITELLTNYGPIDIMWFDQYTNKYTKEYWQTLKALVKSLQPGCLVLANNSTDFSDTDIYGYEYPYLKTAKPGTELPPVGNTNPAEVCDFLGNLGWFWHPGVPKLQTAEEIVNLIRLCNERSANYLLNVPPDRNGLISSPYLERLYEVGKILQVDNK